MGMLANLKNKPSAVKSQYAFLGALILTLVVAGVWTTTIPARFATIHTSVETVSDDTANVTDGIDSFMEQFDLPEAAPTTPEVAQPAGALGALQNWQAPVATTSSTTRELDASPNSSVTATTTDSIPPPSPEPKPTVILIGTTTKKSE